MESSGAVTLRRAGASPVADIAGKLGHGQERNGKALGSGNGQGNQHAEGCCSAARDEEAETREEETMTPQKLIIDAVGNGKRTDAELYRVYQDHFGAIFDYSAFAQVMMDLCIAKFLVENADASGVIVSYELGERAQSIRDDERPA